MRTYTWDEYYEKFYDWAESTRAKNLAYLSSLGNADEVAEVIIEFAEDNKNAANRLLRKANESKMKFVGDDLIEFSWNCDRKLVEEAVKNSASLLTAEDIEDLQCEVDEKVLKEVCKKGNISYSDNTVEKQNNVKQQKNGCGCLWSLVGVLSGLNRIKKGKKKRW